MADSAGPLLGQTGLSETGAAWQPLSRWDAEGGFPQASRCGRAGLLTAELRLGGNGSQKDASIHRGPDICENAVCILYILVLLNYLRRSTLR